MLQSAITQLERNPDWRLLLAAYHARQLLSSDGWVDRLAELDGIEVDQFSRIHGRLIALGVLEFELSGRGESMRYQLSPLGRQALMSEVTAAASFEESEAA